MFVKVAIMCLLFSLQNAQEFYFPTDISEVLQEGGENNITRILSELRGTNEYEKFVDNIISKGVLRLTLAMDRAAITNSRYFSDSENIVYSPVSIAGALALVLLGSNGKTFDEIANIMGLATGVNIHNKSQLVHEQFGRLLGKLEKTTSFSSSNQLKFASAIFVQNDYPIRDVYKETSQSVYKSEVLNLDFRHHPENAQKLINTWVAENTNWKITEILNEAPPSTTRVIITSALYFKSEWEKPFFDGATKLRPFYPNGRNGASSVKVEMMANGGTFPYFRDTSLDCEIMGFPYKGNKTTMYVILPNQSNKQRLKQLENALTPTEVERLVESTKYTASVVLFPKMKIENTIDLKGVLENLNVRSLFNPAEANLALLSPGISSKSKLPNPINGIVKIPGALSSSNDEFLIFSRLGEERNRTNVGVVEKVGKQIKRIGRPVTETLDSIRLLLNRDPNVQNVENPGLYADKVLHKVYMDITESGTEAAAVTSVSLSRDGGRVTFRVDVPFIFFIRHEETKMLLFWGSVNTPSPSFA